MRQLFRILIVFIFIALGAKAYSQTDDTEKALKAEKVAFLTKKLDLTQDEAKKFWPLYDEYWEKKIKILNDRRKLADDFIQNINNITDKEAVDYARRYVESQKRESDLIAEYNKLLLQILPPKKVMLLYQSNYEFKNYLLQKVQETKK
ncbi:MAG: hypothetical protein WBJ36_11355 [Tenuifilum sp.]|uniref:hypothetical protein n=1 Tax=Tenuifilum sp. TaxID=2760880 RepID=UPI001B3E1EC5|nr:hypothetical protein [Bacteroidales bacterium]HOK61301.1 hypothetical protein [Tenuifilum sp.]MBP9030310.1 hypothetical protein [Bacteroidales bacterium]HOK85815.1 hypothetical protein [Tenuifilum sp.]HON70848.1 hypothetical protein [Tenuifilum sp.]